MAVKIVRQPNKIILLGSPTSAAALSAGHEGAPAALRAAGLIDRLRSIGYEVEDFGDDPPQIYKPDEESPRARNISGVLASLDALKPRVEQAVKSGALPLIVSGDCSVALATVAGARRYYRNIGLIYMDRDADLNTPATTSSGCLDGMVVSHITGRGAAELVRFWGEPPLVRDPDVALFGVARIDPAEQEVLQRIPLRRYLAADVRRTTAAAAARAAVERIHGDKNGFVLHFDVDVIADFSATNFPGSDGLLLEDVREALEVFAAQPQLVAVEVTAFNPAKAADGSDAKLVIDLLAEVLAKRLEALRSDHPPQDSESASISSDKSPATESAAAPATPIAVSPDATASASSTDSAPTPEPAEGEAPTDEAATSPESEATSEAAAESADKPLTDGSGENSGEADDSQL